MGELLAGERVHRGGRPSKTGTKTDPVPETLAAKGVTKKESARSKAKAAIPAKRFETTIGEALEAKRSPKKAVAALIAKPKAKPPIEAKPVEASGPATPATGYAVPLEVEAWDSGAAVSEVRVAMRDALDAWPNDVPVETVRAALHRWLGMVRG